MDSYIVRIYRSAGEGSQEITGLVDEVATQLKKPFHNSLELLKILTGKSPGAARKSIPTKAGKDRGIP